jgi:acetyl esterase/lipase
MAFIVGLPLVLMGILLLFRQKPLPRWLCLLLSLVLFALGVLVALGSRVVLVRFGVGRSPILLPFRMLMPAYVWPICWIGALCAFAGIVLAVQFWRRRVGVGALLSVVLAGLGGASSLIAARYINQVTKSHQAEFASAFGTDWQQRLATRTPKMLQHHWSPVRYSNSGAREERDVTFAVVPETKRKLLADLWLPPQGVPPSGIAFLFFHGSAWHFFDKGMGMEPTFRHLAAQGHVVMDVSYRLAPEADLVGMVGDVKRSIFWMKTNAGRYGVDPRRIVVAGASAGGQIAMLAAYSPDERELTPVDLLGQDTTVEGVVSYYGPADMRAYIDHEAGRMTRTGTRATKKVALRPGPMNLEQMMLNVMGGMPDEVPHAYDVAHVASHVTSQAPPSLIFQGEYDFIVQPSAVHDLVAALHAAHVPVIYIEYPETDHGFDCATVFPKSNGVNLPVDSQFAPPTESALYDLDRFLGLLAEGEPRSNRQADQATRQVASEAIRSGLGAGRR